MVAITEVLRLVWKLNHFEWGVGGHTEVSTLDLVVTNLRPFVQKACTFTPGPLPAPICNNF